MTDRKLEAAIGDDLIVTDAMREAVRREECSLGGHDFNVIVNAGDDPTAVVCARCGRTWHVRE